MSTCECLSWKYNSADELLNECRIMKFIFECEVMFLGFFICYFVALWPGGSLTHPKLSIHLLFSISNRCTLETRNEVGYLSVFEHPVEFETSTLRFSWIALTLSWRRPLSYRNHSIDLLCKSIDWFLYDNGLRYERVNPLSYNQRR